MRTKRMYQLDKFSRLPVIKRFEVVTLKRKFYVKNHRTCTVVKFNGGDVRYDVKNGSTGLNSLNKTKAQIVNAIRLKSGILSLRYKTHVITTINLK